MIYFFLGIIISIQAIGLIVAYRYIQELKLGYSIIQEQFITAQQDVVKLSQEKAVKETVKAFPNIPLCQFCKDPLRGRVKRRPDGYWCCEKCSILVFGDHSSSVA